jgi:hypothetical protein
MEIDLDWSQACQSNWTEVFNNTGPFSGFTEVDVYGTDPAAGGGNYSAFVAFGCNCAGQHIFQSIYGIWGNLVYSPGCAKGEAYNYTMGFDYLIYQPGCPPS